MRGRSVCAVAATVLLAVACSSGSGGGGDGESAGATTTTGFAPGGCLERSSTVPRQTPPGDADVHLIDSRVTRLDNCADEVVFEFRSGGRALPPGYEIGYEGGPTFVDFDSGDEFDMSGEAFLVIRFERTGTVEVTGTEGEEDFTSTYLGRESIVPSGMNHLQEARMVQAPEGMVQWVIGLDSERPFTVDGSTLPRPLPPEPTASVPEGDDDGGDVEPGATTTSSTTTTTTDPGRVTAKIVLRIG